MNISKVINSRDEKTNDVMGYIVTINSQDFGVHFNCFGNHYSSLGTIKLYKIFVNFNSFGDHYSSLGPPLDPAPQGGHFPSFEDRLPPRGVGG